MNIEKIKRKYAAPPAGVPSAAPGPHPAVIAPSESVPARPEFLRHTIGELMANTPLRIQVSRKNLRIFSVADGWEYQNDTTWRKFSDLSARVFLDDGTRDLLHALQPGVYDAKTIDPAVRSEIDRRMNAEKLIVHEERKRA